MSIGENIQFYRERRGISQGQLAARVGKTRSAISQYESGKIVPRMGVVEDLATALGVKKTDLIETHYAAVTLPTEEDELLSIYRSLDERGRSMLMAAARALR